MKATKKVLALLFVLCWISAAIIPAHAAEVQPMTDSTYSAKLTLLISPNGQASCTALVTTRVGSQRIEVSMSLNQLNGKTPLKSWQISGIGHLSETKTYYVTSGYDYQVTATVTVRDSSGKFIESFTTASDIVHY